MTGDEFKTIIAKLGLSQRQVGRLKFLGVCERQIRKWRSGEARIPDSAQHLLRVMVKYKISVEDVEKLAKR